MGFVDLVNQNYIDLNETDKGFSNYILDHLDQIPSISTNDFAKVCHSSKSAVIRYAQKLGFTGFGELRNYIKWQADEGKYTQNFDLKKQIFNDIQNTLDYIDKADWNELYEVIYSSKHIYTISTGVTQQSQAAELERLFLLINKPVQTIPPSAHTSEFRRILERLTEDDVVIVLSLSGENRHLERILDALSVRSATLLSITSLQSNVLSGRADYRLYASSSRSPLPQDWWLQTVSTFFILIESFAFGYVNYVRQKKVDKE